MPISVKYFEFLAGKKTERVALPERYFLSSANRRFLVEKSELFIKILLSLFNSPEFGGIRIILIPFCLAVPQELPFDVWQFGSVSQAVLSG